MRRLALLVAVGATWLFLAALPALADGGPHVMTINNGSLGINADSCAGCHRAHTAQGPMIINAASEEELCLTCHSAASTGATTDVMTGLQYVPAGDGTRTAAQLGALRAGGFDQARLDAGAAARTRFGTGIDDFSTKVQVGAAEDVTSAHLSMLDNGLTMPGIAWGNDGTGTGPGPTVALGCGTCHNPHGNGQYRILNPIPDPVELSGTFVPVVSPGAPIGDSPVDNPDAAERDTKNYTVIQVRGTQGNNASFLLYADDVLDLGYGPTTGDYFHRSVPWNVPPSGSTGTDAPNGRPSSFNTQMINWCLACHTRYYSVDASSERVDPITGDPDMLFRYQHQTTTNGQTACTTCHVAHGSNAAMTGTFSSLAPYPDDPAIAPLASTSASSRLLKFDNRGTCQACHDPTDTTTVGSYTGPLPTPGAP